MLQYAASPVGHCGGRPLPGATRDALEGCRCPIRRAGLGQRPPTGRDEPGPEVAAFRGDDAWPEWA
eukprot:9536687-Lingulodinium_polyedra.AAC.1